MFCNSPVNAITNPDPSVVTSCTWQCVAEGTFGSQRRLKQGQTNSLMQRLTEDLWFPILFGTPECFHLSKAISTSINLIGDTKLAHGRHMQLNNTNWSDLESVWKGLSKALYLKWLCRFLIYRPYSPLSLHLQALRPNSNTTVMATSWGSSGTIVTTPWVCTVYVLWFDSQQRLRERHLPRYNVV
jgi:hypothetical protein